MLETLSDYISIVTLVLLTVSGAAGLIAVSCRHHAGNSARREQAFLNYLQNAVNDNECRDDDLQV